MNDNLLSLGIKKVASATCTISSNNKQSYGFLVSLPINMGDRYLFGLLTSNNILPEEKLKVDSKFNIHFIESNQAYDYIITEDSFVFTCPFLDISFVEIPLGSFDNVEYLRAWDEPQIQQKCYFINKSDSSELKFIEGNITEFYGYDIIYKIHDKNIDFIFNGTPLISLSKFSLGDVIGINKGFFNNLNNEKISAVHINIIINSIKSLVSRNIQKPLITLSPAKNLSKSELDYLEKIGLQSTNNQNIFISPAFFIITPLWFYRTQYAWFWTPTRPINYNMEEIKKCNWSLIKSNMPIIAIGGIYNNRPPAQKNIKLIKTLINSGLKFLSSQ